MGATDKNGAFVYDPSRTFRGFLMTIAHHEWVNWARKRKEQGWTDEAGAQFETREAAEAERDLKEAIQAEFERELMDLAMPLVQARVASHTWEAFRLTAIDGVKGTEAADRLKMPLASVFQAKSRVQQLLKDEVERLMKSEDQ